MADYTKATDFAAKDTLTSGDPDKVVKGTEIDDEFVAIASAVATKLDVTGDTITGDITHTDGVKNIFGTGGDMEIFHNGTNNVIDSKGASSLLLQDDGVTKASVTSSGLTITGDIAVSGTVDGRDVAADGATLDAIPATYVDVAGDTMTGDLNFSDGVKANFGAGSDLQIYHDGSHSYVRDVGTGDLRLAGNNLSLLNGDLNATFLSATNGGAVSIRHNNSTKLATTSTGIDVTGTATMDGLTVDGGSTTLSSTSVRIDMVETDTVDVNTRIRSANGDFYLETINDALNSATTRFRIDHATGDISFYEDTGTTAKFFWDASNEGLNVGGKTNFGYNINAGDLGIGIDATASASLVFRGTEFRLQGVSASPMQFYTSNTERMRIDSSGNVGIGVTDPSNALTVRGSATRCLDLQQATIGGETGINFQVRNNSSSYISIASVSSDMISGTTGLEAGDLRFNTMGNGTSAEAMRIDSSGNLLVGTTDTLGTTQGFKALSSGLTRAVRSSDVALAVSRLTTDGDIAVFQKDGATVGSIGVGGSNDLYIGNADTGLIIADDDYITPFNPSTLSGRDAAIDLGQSWGRFKDLYLSGGVYLGGTGAANHLDDYESGTWTPAFGANTSDPTVTYSEQVGYYVKVGDLVHVSARLTVTSASGGSGLLELKGLPFQTPSLAYNALSMTRIANLGVDLDNISPMTLNSSGVCYFYGSNNTTGSWSTLQAGDLTNNTNITISGTYIAA